MKKTTTLNLPNRLTQYSALSLAFAGLEDVHVQVDYTPNLNAAGPGYYTLDLNGDLIDDFRIGGGLYGNYLSINGMVFLPEILS